MIGAATRWCGCCRVPRRTLRATTTQGGTPRLVALCPTCDGGASVARSSVLPTRIVRPARDAWSDPATLAAITDAQPHEPDCPRRLHAPIPCTCTALPDPPQEAHPC